MHVTIPEARRRLSQLIRSAQAGQEVVISEDGEPVARLVPVISASMGVAPKGRAKAVLGWLQQHPLPPAACRTAPEIDAAIAAERAAWD